MEQATQVAQYFDAVSAGYRSRYEPKNPFHNYFFRQRLAAATAGYCFSAKRVLDIGAGTGALYDELIDHFPTIDYVACDIAAQMLAQSNIPPARALVGLAPDLSYPMEQFDFIFSLGVTSYQTPEELTRTWRFIGERLAPDGIAILSFTNRGSVDHVVRRTLKVAKPLVKRGVFGQSFKTYAYRAGDVEQMARRVGLVVSRTAFINATFTPFNSLFPKPSVALAKLIERRAPNVPALSSDFVVFVTRP